MHRLLLSPPKDAVVDHINGDTLDNRRRNLHVVSTSENCQNRKLSCNNSSGHRNVTWDAKRGLWRVRLTLHYKLQTIGWFDDLEDASSAARAARARLFTNSRTRCPKSE